MSIDQALRDSDTYSHNGYTEQRHRAYHDAEQKTLAEKVEEVMQDDDYRFTLFEADYVDADILESQKRAMYELIKLGEDARALVILKSWVAEIDNAVKRAASK